MSLTLSVPFTILTYDPLSSDISYIGLNRERERERELHEIQGYTSSGVREQSRSPQTHPKESKDHERPDKTPSARAKVLPWVQGVQAEKASIPDDMFGPYPSRPNSMAGVAQHPGPLHAPLRHPYAYSAGPTLPFAALGQSQPPPANPGAGAGHRPRPDSDRAEVVRQRPESEVLSRGAGMRALNRPAAAYPGGEGKAPAPGDETPGDETPGDETPGGMSGTSVGMGTFGLDGKEPSQLPLPKSRFDQMEKTASPKKGQSAVLKPSPSDAPPTVPSKSQYEPAQPKPDSDKSAAPGPPPHFHKPHHEFPFSQAEAQAKQLVAMEEARAAALAQLEAAQHNSDIQLEHEMIHALGIMGSGVTMPMGGFGGFGRAGGMGVGHATGQGPRQTFDTQTSGPSFGHIHHANGMPISASARPSMQPAPRADLDLGELPDLPSELTQRQLQGLSDGSFIRIPLGVPTGMSIPPPFMVLRESSGGPGGLGLGVGGLLNIIQGRELGPEERARVRGPDDRSAFVETVEDEDEIRSDVRSETRSRVASPPAPSPVQRTEMEGLTARAESGLFGQQGTRLGTEFTARAHTKPQQSEHHIATTNTPSIAPTKVESKAPTKVPRAGTRAGDNSETKAGTKAPTARAPSEVPRVASGVSQTLKAPTQYSRAHPPHPSQYTQVAPPTMYSQVPGEYLQTNPQTTPPRTLIPEPDQRTIYSQVRTKNTPTVIPQTMHDQEEYVGAQPNTPSVAPSHHESVAPTTISNVKRLVADSKFHDETLCQLLDAARLNLIGDEAKKALQRAARARVIELRDLREAGAIEEGFDPAQLEHTRGHGHEHGGEPEPRSSHSTPRKDKDKRAKSREKRKRSASGKSDKTETVTAGKEPPTWAQDIMSRLSAFDARFAALEHQKTNPQDPTHEHDVDLPVRQSQLSQDVPSNLLDELIFNDFPTSGFTNGIIMPQKLPGSILSWGQAPGMGGMGMPFGMPFGIPPRQQQHQDQTAETGVPSHYSHKPLSHVQTGTVVPQSLHGETQPVGSHYTQQAPGTALQYTQHTQPAPTQSPASHSTIPAPTQVDPGAQPRPTPGRSAAAADGMTWGSEVELPHPGDNIPVPSGPQINIQAPTEPNTWAPTARSRTASRASQAPTATGRRTPDSVRNDVVTDQPLPVTTPPDAREKDLPPQPAESIESNVLGVSQGVPGAGPGMRAGTETGWSVGQQTMPAQTGYGGFQPDQYPPIPQGIPPSMGMGMRAMPGMSEMGMPGMGMAVPGPPPGAMLPAPTTMYGTAKPPTTHASSQHQQPHAPRKTPVPTTTQPSADTLSTIHMQLHDTMTSPRTGRGKAQSSSPPGDKVHIVDPLHLSMDGWKPWDVLTQRLYSWALILEEQSFVRALEEISLSRQVDAFPLSVFMMMTYKRWVRRIMSEMPPTPCDKLMVPPNLAIAINVAVHSRRYHEAKEILVEIWDCLGQKAPPRVIIALAPLGNETDQWAAHRYDLVGKRLSTYRVSHLSEIQTDGRSFWWWEAIRQAWPQLQVPDMNELEHRGGQRIINEHRGPEWKHENSLFAANIARNLLLGYRPERTQDLTKMRELIWAEVKRLLNKKRNGRLIVEPGSPEHLYDA